MLGVMIDCSRNAVFSISEAKKYADLLAKMGYDTVMLYTEDTYEVNGEPYFGYMRGRYSKDELKELDRYCNQIGIELVPCIQTLAHCNAIFHVSKEYEKIRDCDDIMLIDHPRTYELIENMLSTISECFTSRKIHLGMDEASKVGLGKYLNQNGYTDRFNLINRHLHKVCEIADKYGFQPMVWSDMFCALATDVNNLFAGDVEKIKEKANLPQNLSLVYWDYYNSSYDHYIRKINMNRIFNRPVVFAGGAWTWRGFVPDNGFSITNTAAAMAACNGVGVKDVFLTLWGDDGCECSRYAVLPTLLFAAEAYRGNTDLDDIQKKFKELTGSDWNAFMLLDEPDKPGGEHRYNPSKYLLYNDVFTGLNDYRITKTDAEYYRALLLKFDGLEVSDTYRYIFDTAKALCELLAVKADLGIRTREAYLAKDKEALKGLADKEYYEAISLTEIFHKVFWKQWSRENKPFGFDIQDIRLGGVIMRLKSCRERLYDYLCGNVDSISELEQELLAAEKNNWSCIATPNVVTHQFFG